MGRKKKTDEHKVPRALRDIQSALITQIDRPESPDVPPELVEIGRLGIYPETSARDPVAIAKVIRFSKQGAVFCDSTVFIAPTEPEIWEALLEERRAILISPLLSELKWWLGDSHGSNPHARKFVEASIAASSIGELGPIEIVDRIPSPDLRFAIDYYVKLLSIRKKMGDIGKSRFERKFGRSPSNQELSNSLQQAGGASAQVVAKQGQSPKVEHHLFNDELLVVTAFIYAISTGTDVTILSGDEVVFDQYMRMIFLLTAHYKAMFVAEHFSADPKQFDCVTVPVPDKRTLVDEEAIFLRGPVDLIDNALPPTFRSVQIHCMLLQETVARATFRAELEMNHLFRVKRQTAGLNTDRFDGNNCHFYLGPTARKTFARGPIIGHDYCAKPQGTDLTLSANDVELSMHHIVHYNGVRNISPTE